MISVPETLPDDPVVLKQLLLSLHEQMFSKDKEMSAKDEQVERLWAHRSRVLTMIGRLMPKKEAES
jgi:transposase